jgi:hypothetical protein
MTPHLTLADLDHIDPSSSPGDMFAEHFPAALMCEYKQHFLQLSGGFL